MQHIHDHQDCPSYYRWSPEKNVSLQHILSVWSTQILRAHKIVQIICIHQEDVSTLFKGLGI